MQLLYRGGFINGLYLLILCLFFLNDQPVYSAGVKAVNHSSSQNYQKEKPTETIEVKIIPHQKNGLFDGVHPIKYDVTIINYYKGLQEGKISIDVKTAKGIFITKIETDIKLKGGAKKRVRYLIPVTAPGFYELLFHINVTDHDDTIRNVFGYKVFDINTTVHKPPDFEQFWQNTIDELHATDPAYSVELDMDRTTSAHSVYNVHMRSLGGVIVQGWLTVPKVKGKYPVLVALPGCKVNLKPILADEFVLFLLNIRVSKAQGEEVLDKEIDYALYNIDNKDKYIYRGAYMDCVRAIDFLFAYKDMGFNIDVSRIGVSGGSQGGALALVTAALDHRVKACVADNPIYCDVHNLIAIAESKTPVSWPIIRYKQYLQRSPYLNMKTITNTMDYYDPQNFTPMIQCPILLAMGALDILAPPSTIIAAYNKLSTATKKKSEIYNFYFLAHEVEMKHRHLQTGWLMEKLVHPQN